MSLINSRNGDYQDLLNNGGVVSSLTGTNNQIAINGSYVLPETGDVILTLPQNIHTGASPTFNGLTLSGLSTGLVYSTSGALGVTTLNTDNIPEGTTNLYFTNTRARAALSSSDPITYDSINGIIGVRYTANLRENGTYLDIANKVGIGTSLLIGATSNASNYGLSIQNNAVNIGTGATGYGLVVSSNFNINASNGISAAAILNPLHTYQATGASTGAICSLYAMPASINRTSGTLSNVYNIYCPGNWGTVQATNTYNAYFKSPASIGGTNISSLYTDDLNCGVAISGAPTLGDFRCVAVKAGLWNGSAIGATYGGTGQTSYAVGDILYANTTTTIAKRAAVATGSVLISQGINTAPIYSNSPSITRITTSGQAILCGNTGSGGYNTLSSIFVGTPPNTTANNATIVGIKNQPYFSTFTGQTGVVNYGIWNNPQINPTTGTVANFYGLYNDTFSNGAGSITNYYGAVFKNISGMTPTTTSIALLADNIVCSTSAAGLKPNAGQTITDTLKIGTLAGILKATSGVVSNGATTTDLTEGTNLYFTNARAIAAIGISGFSTPILLNAGVLSLGYTSEFKMTGSNLDLPQSIKTTATPTFTGININTGPGSGIISNLQGAMTSPFAVDSVGEWFMPTLSTLYNASAMYGKNIKPIFNGIAGYLGPTYAMRIQPSYTGSATTGANYSLFVSTPTAGTSRCAIYGDNINCGVSANTTYTNGLIQAVTLKTTGLTTASNINLSDFTFANSLACAATAYTSIWNGMSANVNANFTLSRFGYNVTLRISYFIYPSTQVGVVPYIALNPGGWAPAGNIVVPIIANHNNSYIQCCLHVNTNCTIYIYGPLYNNAINTTNGGQSFPADCVVSWSMY